MQLNISSTKEDFLKFCIFKLIFFKENSSNSYFENLAEIYEVPQEKRWSLKLEEEEKKKFILEDLNENIEKEYGYFVKNYKEIKKEDFKKLEAKINVYISKYLEILDYVFGHYDLGEVELSLISTPIEKDIKLLPAFVIKTLPKKIFFSVKEDSLGNEENLLFYTKTFLHELGHVFLNNHPIFQKILVQEWREKYKHIDSWNYRNIVEELIASSLIFSYKDFGFLYSDLGLKEDEEEKIDSLGKNKFRAKTFDFLKRLKENKAEGYFEKEFPLFIKDFVDSGVFKS